MVSNLTKAAVLDALLIAAAYFVFGDQVWRASFASSEHFVATVTYLPFIQFFSMSGWTIPLESPPTLDWLQVFLAIIVVSNLYYAWRVLSSRRDRGAGTGGQGNPSEPVPP